MQCMQSTEYKHWHRHWLDVVVIGVDAGRTVLATLHAGLHAYTSWQYWMNKRDSRNVGNWRSRAVLFIHVGWGGGSRREVLLRTRPSGVAWTSYYSYATLHPYHSVPTSLFPSLNISFLRYVNIPVFHSKKSRNIFFVAVLRKKKKSNKCNNCKVQCSIEI